MDRDYEANVPLLRRTTTPEESAASRMARVLRENEEARRAGCRHYKARGVHCKQCQMAGYCACEECERDAN